MFLTIKAKPNSTINQVKIDANGDYQIKLKAPATDGKANEALIAYLATVLDLPKSAIILVSGFTSPFKRLAITGDDEAITERLIKAAQK